MITWALLSMGAGALMLLAGLRRIASDVPTSLAQQYAADAHDAAARYWRCYHEGCGKPFVHARYLASHLVELHGEGAAR